MKSVIAFLGVWFELVCLFMVLLITTGVFFYNKSTGRVDCNLECMAEFGSGGLYIECANKCIWYEKENWPNKCG